MLKLRTHNFPSCLQPKIYVDQNNKVSIREKLECFHLGKFLIVGKKEIMSTKLLHQLNRDKPTFEIESNPEASTSG